MNGKQVKRMSAMLAVTSVLWGGALLVDSHHVYAAPVELNQTTVEVLKKALGLDTTELTDKEKTWFNQFFAGRTVPYTDTPHPKWSFSGVNIERFSGDGIVVGHSTTPITNSIGNSQVFGTHNYVTSQVKVLGQDNFALGEFSVVMGYQNTSLGAAGIAFGHQSLAAPVSNEGNRARWSQAIAIGEYAFANGYSYAIGNYSNALGQFSTAIGTASIAGKKETLNFLLNTDGLEYNNQPYFWDLQQRYPELFGSWPDKKDMYNTERFDDARHRIYELYKDYFESIGIKSYEELSANGRDKRLRDIVLNKLGWHYALAMHEPITAPTAIGTQAHAYNNYSLAVGAIPEAAQDYGVALGYRANVKAGTNTTNNKAFSNGVAIGRSATIQADQGTAIGAFSVVTANHGIALGMESESLAADVVSVDSTPYSNMKLNIGGNGKTGADNEILRGPLSIGSKLYGDSGEQTGTFIRQVRYVADGTEGTDAVNLRQLRGALLNGIIAGDGVTITPQGNPTQAGYGTITISVSGSVGSGGSSGGSDTPGTTYTAGSNLQLQNGEFSLKNNLTNMSSISGTGGKVAFNTDGVTITSDDTALVINEKGLDMGDTGIHNLADGKAYSDAATVGQLKSSQANIDHQFENLNSRVHSLDRRIEKVGAGAAALAGLHPLDYDPDNKLDIAGGYGHYRGQSAMALGAYYRPNENLMFSVGSSFGNGDTMFNAGVSVKVGAGNSNMNTSKTAMVKRINELQQVVATQNEKLQAYESNMAKQEAEIQELKDMMQQIMHK